MTLEDEIAIADDEPPAQKRPIGPAEGPCGQPTDACNTYSLYSKSIPHGESPDDICNYCSKNPSYVQNP